jgi:hypothetical protein
MRNAALVALACLALGVPRLEAQMMGGGREVRAGREVVNERLADASTGQRAWLDAMRDERAGLRTTAQRLTLRAGLRSYALDAAEVSESLARLTYSLRRPGMKLRVAGGPLRFSSGDTVTIAGLTPIEARLDLALGFRDSLRIALRAPSSPMTLSGAQVAALASVGTATVDLASVDLGTPAGILAGWARTYSLGSGSLSGTLGVEYEPRPSAHRWSYWRGTTVRAGLLLAADAGRARVTAGVDAARSFSDSLSGRNLFPGGGSVLARAGVSSYLGGGDDVLLDVSTFYFRPFASERVDAANRRIPVGDFVGASALGLWSVRQLLVTPTLVISRESSHGAAAVTATSGSGWAVGSSLAVDVPLGARFGVTPELGYARGSLRSEFSQQGTGIGRIVESLSGWWLAADISMSF